MTFKWISTHVHDFSQPKKFLRIGYQLHGLNDTASFKEYKNNAEHTQFKVKMDSKNLDQKLPRLTRELEFFMRELERARQNERMSEHINYNVKRKNLCLWIVGLLMIANIAICLTQISRCTSRCEIKFPKQQILQLFFEFFIFTTLQILLV